MGLERPVEAKNITLSCVATTTAQCLADKIQIANHDYANQYDILLGKGKIRLTKSLIVTTPNWLRIIGLGSGLTSIHGPCFPLSEADATDYYGGLTEEDFYKNPGLAECQKIGGYGEFSVLQVQEDGVLVLDSLSIGNGQASIGAGILNEGILLVYRSSIMHNHAHLSGGGIYQAGPWLYLQDTMVNNNIVHQGYGGGIFIAGGRVDIQYSTIHSNWTWGMGFGAVAGIANGLEKDPDRNSPPEGGVLVIVNSTISGNVDNAGGREFAVGGILNVGIGEAWLKNVTITNNVSMSSTSKAAGGVYSSDQSHGFYFWNTIIAKNGMGEYDNNRQKLVSIDDRSDCGGLVRSLGGNLVGTDRNCQINSDHDWDPPGVSVPMDQKNTNPGFTEGWVDLVAGAERPLLRDNGGNTCTVALKTGSPAYDNAWTGKPGDHVFACEPYDQRWAQRGRLDKGVFKCDIGAYEYPVASPDQIGVGCPDQ
jgi:hypothetical protein